MRAFSLLAFFGLVVAGCSVESKFAAPKPSVHVAIAAWPWGAYLGEDGITKGIRVKTSSFTRHHVNASLVRAKASGYYINSILANSEATSDGYDEALAVANDTPFGLSSGICTSSLKHAQHFKQYSEAGMVMVNLATAGVDYHVPFGGRKGSSYGGREQGRYAIEFYTNVKTSYVLPV